MGKRRQLTGAFIILNFLLLCGSLTIFSSESCSASEQQLPSGMSRELARYKFFSLATRQREAPLEKADGTKSLSDNPDPLKIQFDHIEHPNNHDIGQKVCRVASFDGEGIRIIPTLYLLRALEINTGKPCLDLFDIFVGNGTGGFVAFLLSHIFPERKSFTVLQLLKIFTLNFPALYKPTPPFSTFQYDAANLQRMCDMLVGDVPLLKDQFRKQVLILGYSLTNGHEVLVDTNTVDAPEKDGVRGYSEWEFPTLKSTLQMTLTIPGYLEPYDLVDYLGRSRESRVTDASLYEPCLSAFITQKLSHEGQKDLDVTSFGSGCVSNPVFSTPTDAGQYFYTAQCARVGKLMETLKRESSKVHPPQRRLLTYTCIQPLLPQAAMLKVDDASQGNIDRLLDVGYEASQGSEFHALCRARGVETLIDPYLVYQEIINALRIIDFEETNPFSLVCIVEHYLRLSDTQKQMYMEDRLLFSSSKVDVNFSNRIIKWTNAMMSVVSAHNEEKSWWSKWKSSGKSILNLSGIFTLSEGNHRDFYDKLVDFKTIIQGNYVKSLGVNPAVTPQYIEIMSEINLMDLTKQGARSIISIFARDNEKTIDLLYFHNKFFSNLGSFRLTKTYLTQIITWAQWLTSLLEGPKKEKYVHNNDEINMTITTQLSTVIFQAHQEMAKLASY